MNTNSHENSEKEFLNNKAKRKGHIRKTNKPVKLSKFKKVILTVLIIIAVLVLAVFGAYTYFKNIYKPSHVTNDNSGSGIAKEVIDTNTGEKIQINNTVYTFLAIGCDKSESLTDVIMLATYNMKDDSVAIMSIPRDTYVKYNTKLILNDSGAISRSNFDQNANSASKINEIYNRGRKFAETELDRLVSESKNMTDSQIKQLCEESYLDIDTKTLKNYTQEKNQTQKTKLYNEIRKQFGIKYLSMLIYYNFGVPVDFYAQVNISGFRNIVDAIGGVDVVIQHDMYYHDPTQDLLINLKAGPQHLDGKKAEQFVRFRYGYVSADLARIDAQKIFMTAFIKKLLSISTVTKIDDIVTEIQKNLSTNLSVSDVAFFGTNALELDLSKITMITLPGASEYINGISYYSANKQAVIETVNTYLNKYSKPLPETSFCITNISNKAPQGTGVLTADDISNDELPLYFVSGNKVTSNSNSDNLPSDEVSETQSGSADTQNNSDISENLPLQTPPDYNTIPSDTDIQDDDVLGITDNTDITDIDTDSDNNLDTPESSNSDNTTNSFNYSENLSITDSNRQTENGDNSQDIFSETVTPSQNTADSNDTVDSANTSTTLDMLISERENSHGDK